MALHYLCSLARLLRRDTLQASTLPGFALVNGWQHVDEFVKEAFSSI